MDTFADDVEDRYVPDAVEERVAAYWEEVDAYEKATAHREGGEEFFFVDGPPYTSGAAHMGTTWNKTLKDAHLRYLRMNGYDVTDRPGWDMHGLPIEVKVEQELGFDNKKDIQEYGEEAFIEKCKEFAVENMEAMTEDFQSFGVWMDWEDPYETVDPEYMEAAWWGFARAHERGLVERGLRSINQCPRCETAIANNEVEYHEVESPSIYVRFPLRDREGSLVVWTTTPWTIPANTFVAVGEELTYQKVRARKGGEEEVLWLAEPCVEDVLREGRYEDYEVEDELAGNEMVGWEYDHPLDEEVPAHPAGDGALRVYTADYVEADRTGLVHSAPGHGEEDFERGQELDLEIFCPVRGDGTYTAAGGDYVGEFVRDANDDVVADLDAKGLLLASDTTRHRYGQCWRCDTDVVQLATTQWFITITDIKDELLDSIEESEWYPQWARDNRFRDFVEDAPDWNVSRQRYWGIPVPIWLCEDDDCEHLNVVDTREELAERAHQDVDPEAVDLHKPTVDDLTMDCAACGARAERVPDVFDVWLDSSVATWGTLDYPSAGEERFEELWPADLIIEAHDQTRGWFWSQLGMGKAALDEVPYETVLMHGFANDEDGRKMSKSVGNVVQPEEAIERHGADAMRLFLLSVTPQGEDMRFSWDEMENMERDLNILWNVFRFPLPYMEMDGFDPAETAVEDCDLETADEWVLSRLQTVTEEVDRFWEVHEQHRGLEALLEFVVEDVSRYYVQLVRERMWEEADTGSKRAAYATLYRVLRETVALLAPFAPYVTEEIYQHLTDLGSVEGHDTVHMCDWPTVDRDLRDPGLEERIETVRAIEEAGSHARQRAGRKLRWPVRRVVVDAEDDAVVRAVREHETLLAERLNAQSVELVAPGEDWDELGYTAEADMSVLGPEFGDEAGDVMRALNGATVEEPSLSALADAVEDELGRRVELTTEMVEFVEVPPDAVDGAAFDGGTVYVDTALTEDIESEGYAREIIRRVQEMRKDLDLEMDEAVRLDVLVFDDRVAELVAEREDLVREEVRAAELGEVEDGYRKEWEIEGVEVHLAVAPLPNATV
ncbi:MAG: isoleucine--tRNA ligase [Halobacteriaceae archaeon]